MFDFLLAVSNLCLTLRNPMNCSMPGFPVLHYLSEFAQTHVHWVNDAIQASYLSPSSPLALSLSHQGLFQWVSSWYHVAKVLELCSLTFFWNKITKSLLKPQEVLCLLSLSLSRSLALSLCSENIHLVWSIPVLDHFEITYSHAQL